MSMIARWASVASGKTNGHVQRLTSLFKTSGKEMAVSQRVQCSRAICCVLVLKNFETLRETFHRHKARDAVFALRAGACYESKVVYEVYGWLFFRQSKTQLHRYIFTTGRGGSIAILLYLIL